MPNPPTLLIDPHFYQFISKISYKRKNGNPFEVAVLLNKIFGGRPVRLPTLTSSDFYQFISKISYKCKNGNPFDVAVLLNKILGGRPVRLPTLTSSDFYQFTSKISYKRKNGNPFEVAVLLIKSWRLPTLPSLNSVPSAVRGLTSLFEMGRGEHPPYKHHEALPFVVNYSLALMSSV
jgi:hypothetical protein